MLVLTADKFLNDSCTGIALWLSAYFQFSFHVYGFLYNVLYGLGLSLNPLAQFSARDTRTVQGRVSCLTF